MYSKRRANNEKQQDKILDLIYKKCKNKFVTEVKCRYNILVYRPINELPEAGKYGSGGDSSKFTVRTVVVRYNSQMSIRRGRGFVDSRGRGGDD